MRALSTVSGFGWTMKDSFCSGDNSVQLKICKKIIIDLPFCDQLHNLGLGKLRILCFYNGTMLFDKNKVWADSFLRRMSLIAFLLKFLDMLIIIDTLAYIAHSHIKVPFFSSWFLIKIFTQLIKVELVQLLELLFEFAEFFPPSTTTSI